MKKEALQAIFNAAYDQGYEAGKAAGSWIIDGNTTDETARRILQGLEDGDPEIMDTLPNAPLSGEWADGLTPRDLLAEYELSEDDDDASGVLDAFEDGYMNGVNDEVERSARAILED